MTDKVGATIRAFCAKCAGERNCEIKGYHLESGESGQYYYWSTAWHLLACKGCDYVFAQTVSSNSEEYYQDYGPNGEAETTYIETVETWPARSKRALPEWYEHHIVATDLENTVALNGSLKELYRALNADLLVLSAIGIRTAFDIAAELLGVHPSLQFEEKLGQLVSGNHIPEAEKGNFDALLNAGHGAAHRGWEPTSAEVDALMTALEGFIFNAIVFPARKREEARKLAEIGARVPKRLPRPKKTKASSTDVEASS